MGPQRRQPTRFPCPWDSPGKNTGVGCHFLLQCMTLQLSYFLLLPSFALWKLNNINNDDNNSSNNTATGKQLHWNWYSEVTRRCTRRRQWHPTPVLLPGKSHGLRGLVGCSPWGRKESDTTERLQFDFSLSCIGEGNGNLLQCSCLENPRDRGAWWAAIYGVAQSRTWLKWLSSSSNSSLLI